MCILNPVVLPDLPLPVQLRKEIGELIAREEETTQLLALHVAAEKQADPEKFETEQPPGEPALQSLL